MNWLFPGFLVGALAVALPFVLHLLRRRRRQPVIFPSFRFLTASSRQTQSSRQRLSRWLVLALRAAVFALLTVAFARPFQSGGLARESRAVVVVVDTSFSLQAKGRWEELRTWAQEKIGPLPVGDKLGIMLTAPQPAWLIPPTAETDRARQSLATLTPGWSTSRIEPALRLASEALAALPNARRELIVLTDHQRLSWAGSDFSSKLSPGINVSFSPIPKSIETQAAVVSPVLVATEKALRATVQIRNYTGAQKRTLRVFRDDAIAPLREETLALAPHELRTIDINLPGSAETAAQFRFMLDPDDLPADDSAYAVWQPGGGETLLLDPASAKGGTDFVLAAWKAAADLDPSLKLAPLPSDTWPARAVAVLRNETSFTDTETLTRLETFLENGGVALLFATGGPGQIAWLATHGITITPLPTQSEPWQVHDWALDHPLVTALSQRRLEVLLGWEFKQGWALPLNALTPLARWSETAAAIGELRVGRGRILICGFSPDRRATDWPITPSFVPFLHQAAIYLLRSQSTATVTGQVGTPLALNGTTGRWRALAGPEAGRAAIDAVSFVTPLAPGIYEFSQGADRKIFAVNLAREESDLATWESGTPWLGLVSDQPAPAPKIPRSELAATEAEQRSPLWWWAAAAAALLMLSELLVANRTAR